MTDATVPPRSAWTNTSDRYGLVHRTFHWTIALGILAMIPLGIVANEMAYDTSEALARKATLFSIHKTLGVLILFVALARIAWAVAQPKPAHLHPERRAETWLAETVHWLLYGSLVLVPLSGWVSHSASEGFAPIWWPLGQSLPIVPKSEAVYATASALHIVFERVLVLSLVLHVAGALKHHLWDRDATLRRMALGEPAAPKAARSGRGTALAAPAAAVVVVAAAVGVGGALGLYGADARATETATLAPLDAPVASGWTVDEGTLAIAVTQLGSTVSGSFSDWTAAIDYDEATGSGDVEVVVNIVSLTLGSVTDQALGTDFFSAEAFPRATFAAAIVPAPQGAEGSHIAEGTLSLRGAEVPVALPFDLTVEGDRASAEGIVTVDRRDFAIGESYADPGTLAFEVVIDVALEAVRSE